MPLPAMAEIQRRIASLEQQFFKLTGGQSVLSGAAASSAQAALSSRGTPTVPAGSATGTAVTSGLMALQQLEDLASDGIITPAEKLQLNQDWVIIVAEGNPSTGVLVLQAAKYGLSATAFNAAYANLAAYVTSSGIFTDMSSNTVLDRTVWDGYVEAYAAARSALAQIGAQLGENFIDSTGNVLSDAQVITSQGTAAAITGQGALATQNTMGLSFSNLVAVAPIAGVSNQALTVKLDNTFVVFNPVNGTSLSISANISLSIYNNVQGVNGLDTGSVASSKGYHVFVIYNPTTQTVAGLLSLSPTAPTLPTGYTYFRRVSYASTESGNYNFNPFNQWNYDYYFIPEIIDQTVITSGSPTAIDLSYCVPPNTIAPIGFFSLVMNWTSGNVGVALGFSGAAFIIEATNIAFLSNTKSYATMPIITSQTVYCWQLGGGTGSGQLRIVGFRLNL